MMQFLKLSRCYNIIINKCESTKLHSIKGVFQLLYSEVSLKNNQLKIHLNKFSTSCLNYNNVENEHSLKQLKKWIELYKFEGGKVPKFISESDYEIILEKYQLSLYQASKYLRFLHSTENKKLLNKKRKDLKNTLNKKYRELKEVHDTNHIKYGIWCNALFGKVRKSSLIDYHNSTVINAMKFGQPIIYDCGFDDAMLGRERSSFVTQMTQSITYNRFHEDPYNMYMCNQNPNSDMMHKLKKYMPAITEAAGPNIMSENYLDIFPKEKLIYLTPNASNEMTSYDHDAIYIIGGIVDLRMQRPLTLAKSKREGVKTIKLPLGKYRQFIGSKTLGIHIMTAILLELKTSGDFDKAFNFIPSRLLAEGKYKTRFGDAEWDKTNVLKKGMTDIKKKFSVLEENFGVKIDES